METKTIIGMEMATTACETKVPFATEGIKTVTNGTKEKEANNN